MTETPRPLAKMHWQERDDMQDHFMIDDVVLPAPMSFKIGDEDLVTDQSDRTLDGTAHKEVVVCKEYYDMEFGVMTWPLCSAIMQAVRGKNRVMFHYPSPIEGEWVTKPFYIQTRSASALVLRDGQERWSGLTFRLAEI